MMALYVVAAAAVAFSPRHKSRAAAAAKEAGDGRR
jgi:hypothetical protein